MLLAPFVLASISTVIADTLAASLTPTVVLGAAGLRTDNSTLVADFAPATKILAKRTFCYYFGTCSYLYGSGYYSGYGSTLSTYSSSSGIDTTTDVGLFSCPRPALPFGYSRSVTDRLCLDRPTTVAGRAMSAQPLTKMEASAFANQEYVPPSATPSSTSTTGLPAAWMSRRI